MTQPARNLEALMAEMTLEEKAGLCSGLDFWHLKGVERLGIPSIMLTDGPHGLRKQREGSDHLGLFDSVPATCFPSAAGLACSWDRELIEQVGVALGEECQAEDVAILLGPGTNIKRSPLCGRNFEYFSEDPYLSSELAASHIQGVQSQGVGTSLKHFAANNQEHRRMTTDVIVDERTLREIYLASFEGAVKKAQPWTVMSSYNQVNGAFASENKRLLTDILKDEWGHEGFVVSDWGAVNERDRALAAGLELEMPASNGRGEQKVLDAISSGQLTEAELDQAVLRLLRVIFQAVDAKQEGFTYDADQHHLLARKVAAESMVLLKNDGDLLPIEAAAKVAVIGAFAKQPRYQGGGSSHINPSRLDEPLQEMRKLADQPSSVVYAQGYDLATDETSEELLSEAITAAKAAEVIVIYAGLPDRYESEGYDRTHLDLPANQNRLIHEIAAVHNQVIVILMNGSVINFPWLDQVSAVLECYLGGQAVGGAAADLVYGVRNPSGKLAETFPLQLSDNPSYLNFPGEGDRVEYREGLFVGYRYYDTKNMRTQFPFGYGLSYTTFAYSKLKLDKAHLRDDETLTVTLKVKNTGSRPGKEIVQLYVRDNTKQVIRPDKELKGFAKVALEPGEEKTVTLTLDKRAFAYYNVQLKDWHVHTGTYTILAGPSSQQLVLQADCTVESTVRIPATYSLNTTVGDLLGNEDAPERLRHLIKQGLEGSMFAGGAEQEQNEMLQAMVKFLPLRALLSFTGDSISEQAIIDALDEANG
ncbi:beta-glucosidase [Paenibacillus daejeonensis]|uniref:beta-glucosidase n=1 Tax=Paenibacillus daejeonensis TaxID=135193 RepID=UPI0003730CCA|nr:glycoside hydrolase family 3 C-terminal domain-containing protein [Paenibacillus daejeonensis]